MNIHIVRTYKQFFARRRELFTIAPEVDGYAECRQRCAAGDGPYFWFGEHSFSWECPGCGHSFAGALAPEPVSGWDSPQWAKTGTDEAPTLTPSLGCPGWRAGSCTGHWWLRDGQLVPA